MLTVTVDGLLVCNLTFNVYQVHVNNSSTVRAILRSTWNTWYWELWIDSHRFLARRDGEIDEEAVWLARSSRQYRHILVARRQRRRINTAAEAKQGRANSTKFGPPWVCCYVIADQRLGLRIRAVSCTLRTGNCPQTSALPHPQYFGYRPTAVTQHTQTY